MKNTNSTKPATLADQWKPYIEAGHRIEVQTFNGRELPDKLVQPYQDWRRACEASAPGEAFGEPALTVFPPLLRRVHVVTSYFAVALAYLRAPDPWSAAVLHNVVHRNPDRDVFTFAHLAAAAKDCISIALPEQVRWPGKWSADAVATRALTHAHLILAWGECGPLALAAERAGVYVAAASPWTVTKFGKWAGSGPSES